MWNIFQMMTLKQNSILQEYIPIIHLLNKIKSSITLIEKFEFKIKFGILNLNFYESDLAKQFV